MKTIVIKVVGVVCGLLWSLTVWSDAPLGVGSADSSSGPCFGQIVVGPPGDFTPFLDGVYGVLIVPLGDAKAVFSNSANGNRNLTCHGTVGPGDVVLGIDAATQVGGAWGTTAERSDACSAITTFGLPSPCRGEGEQSAIIIGPEFQGLPCNIGNVPTFNWKSVFNEGGYMLSCHSKD
jgi:hypothetical protein